MAPFSGYAQSAQRRIEYARVGKRFDRCRRADSDLAAAITGQLDNSTLRDTLAANSATMKRAAGVTVAAKAILDLI